MTGRSRMIIAIIGVGVLALAAGLVWRSMAKARIRTVTGTVASIDPGGRTAVLDVVHPKNGSTIRIEGHVPPGCPLTIDGAPAQLADLQVGDRAEVEGAIHADYSITVNWARITRAAASASSDTPPASPAPEAAPNATQPTAPAP